MWSLFIRVNHFLIIYLFTKKLNPKCNFILNWIWGSEITRDDYGWKKTIGDKASSNSLSFSLFFSLKKMESSCIEVEKFFPLQKLNLILSLVFSTLDVCDFSIESSSLFLWCSIYFKCQITIHCQFIWVVGHFIGSCLAVINC